MRFLAAPCVALASLLLTEFAHADAANPNPTPPAPSASTATPAEPVITPGDSELKFEPIPDAEDRLGGHFVLGAAVGPKWTFGALNGDQSQHSQLGRPGLALNLDLGAGITRSVALGVWGEFDDYGAPPECSLCSSKSFAGGPFLRYHVVQGTRFDPWGMFGIGVRQTNIQNGGRSDEHFFGAELLRLSFGADWYATSNIAIGPYFQLAMGTYGPLYIDRLHTDVGTGLRLVLDFPGK
jgi:hypothetical protein